MSPKPAFSAALALMLMLLAPASAEDGCSPEMKAEAAMLIQNYAGKLKAALGGAMQARGPEGALEVCNKQAPAIAAAVSQGSGWSVGRTSLKPRNATSAPDDYERKIMEAFNARIAKGEKAADLVSAEVVEGNGVKTFRFIKAIPTGEMCMTCHGDTVDPGLKLKILALYPDDQATGFKQGDMRGVFTLKKIIEAGDR
jgi:hypothetical protein